MCGIAGIISSNWNRDPVIRMVQQLHHRGPDDFGIQSFTEGSKHVTLGSTRLSIIDLSAAGHMPMQDAETGNWIVYNGEVYNFKELRQVLERSGEQFLSKTDSEVVLKAYGSWGPDCVRRFRGMFAFAIWDNRRHELFLARDRAGVKPLYYYQGLNDLFLFASEIRTLLASNLVSRYLARESLNVYLCNGFTIAPLTMVKGVYSMLPAHWMRVDLDGRIIESTQYWYPPSSIGQNQSSTEAIEEIRSQLEDAVRLRMISDVPLGAFLSGGLDSSTIVALMARFYANIQTFSVTFDEVVYDESPHALWTAKHFGTTHTEIRLRKKDFKTWLPAAVEAMDQPTFDGVNTYCVARASREGGLTVALSGIGSDELFGGYRFLDVAARVSWLARIIGGLPPKIGQMLQDLPSHQPFRVAGAQKMFEFLHYNHQEHSQFLDLLSAYQTTSMLFPTWSQQHLIDKDLWHEKPPNWFGLPLEFLQFIQKEIDSYETIDTLSRIAQRVFLGERCLRDSDSMSMNVSLEVRAPFTDHVLVESLLRIPSKQRCKGVPDKPFEWEIVRPYLGDKYQYRKKQGFEFPFKDWLREDDFYTIIHNTLSDEMLGSRIGFNPQRVRQFSEAFQKGRFNIPWFAVWSLFALFAWCNHNQVWIE